MTLIVPRPARLACALLKAQRFWALRLVSSRKIVWLWLLCLPHWGQAAPLQLAWHTAQGAELWQLNTQQVLSRQTLPANLQTPLGSLWKLFVYAYLEDTGQPDRGYTCQGQDREEVYCCQPGERISREQALAKSCGLYFSASNTAITPEAWQRYWQARPSPAWLYQWAQLQPQTQVPVAELLQVLADLPAQAQARKHLLEVMLQPSHQAALSALGGRLRVKTWSWLAAHDAQMRQGGFAGWLLDGTPLWVGAAGGSQQVLKKYADVLGKVLPTTWPADAAGCVVVDLFARYPVKHVRPLPIANSKLSAQSGNEIAANNNNPMPAPTIAAPGVLRGNYEVEFNNGNKLVISSSDDAHSGDLFLARNGTNWQLRAKLEREEYVARVLDREAAAQPPEAAKALAIAIRTYLLQNAARTGSHPSDCLSIEDSSARQRVAPRPASAQARNIAAWTADLVLAGSPVSYHLNQPGKARLSWHNAVKLAHQGARYEHILLRAFPQANLSRWDQPQAACQNLPKAEQWLQAQRRKWREVLNAAPGYSEPVAFSVCRLEAGKPHVDRAIGRIFVRGFLSQQDRLDLTHEYLHLAFIAHPNGQNEGYIENLTRHLLLE